MDLKTFISETLEQILAGVKHAQAQTDGGNINAEMKGESDGHLILDGISGQFTRVDFDIAVTAETSGSGKGAMKVFSVGVEGGGEHRQGQANRISFSVPVRLPDGDRV